MHPRLEQETAPNSRIFDVRNGQYGTAHTNSFDTHMYQQINKVTNIRRWHPIYPEIHISGSIPAHIESCLLLFVDIAVRASDEPVGLPLSAG